MAKLIYAAIASLDGYVEDEEGRFDWAAPDNEVHAFVNDLAAGVVDECHLFLCTRFAGESVGAVRDVQFRELTAEAERLLRR